MHEDINTLNYLSCTVTAVHQWESELLFTLPTDSMGLHDACNAPFVQLHA